ncbi:hypothetical protein OG982_30085 [Streptomyces sp. NBC_01551]|uniref:hypothetical protein n=1 Tax=Streptomyces sp. NBC_01551 TaxID=2975876 RepID=UPI002254D49C|nr:hypothetical protein [Streptomyces sp. NBC_01551]MCX4529894.1 hypothetical protein [Streptomyces sp. NBC_01551]
MPIDFQRQARRARLRLAGIGLVVLAAVAGGAVALINIDDSGSSQAVSDDAKTTLSPSPNIPSAPGAGSGADLTPATAPKIRLFKPTTTTEGIGRGFEHSAMGARSAAVSYWQDLNIIDDAIARQQWQAITSKDSPDTVDRRVSDVRKTREAAGLPPSGPAPDGISFSTTVTAMQALGLETSGDVVQVWMSYDVYAVFRDKGGNQNPKKGETVYLILKWENGDWRVTDEPQYRKKLTGPQPYHPDSRPAFQDGWREIAHG